MSFHSIIQHPKTWLRANALWPSGRLNVEARGMPSVFKVGTAQEGSHVIPVELRRVQNLECENRAATAMLPCWEVAPTNSMAAKLIYYLPWRPNSTRTMLLGDSADFFITDTMNGCTFAFGPGGRPRVAHVNYNSFNDDGEREEGRPIDQDHMDDEVDHLIPAQATSLRKADYVGDPNHFPNVTVIGVRKGHQWKFYYQRRHHVRHTQTTVVYSLRAVHRIR